MLMEIARQTVRHRLATFVGAFIALTSGVAMLSSANLVVLSANVGGMPAEEAAAINEISSLLFMLASIAAFLSVFVVAATFAFAVGRRERELALLRGIGATPRQVRRLVFLEGLLVAIAAGIVGTLLGLPGGALLVSVLVSNGLAPASFTLTLSAGTVLIAAVVSTTVCGCVATLGTLSAARRAAAIRPIEALRDAAVEPSAMTRSRWAMGLLFSVGGLATAAFGISQGGQLGGALLMFCCYPMVIGLALLAPTFVGPVTALVTALPARLTTVTGTLAAGNIRTATRRSAGTAAPVLLAVGVTVSFLGTLGVLSAAGESETRGFHREDAVVMPGSVSEAAVIRGEAAAIDGVALASTTWETRVALARIDDAWEMDSQHALGVDPSHIEQLFDVTVLAGSLREFTEDSVVVDAGQAAILGWSVGDEVRMTVPDGGAGTEVVVRVAAIFAGGEMAALPLLIPATLVEEHAPAGATPAIRVVAESDRLISSVLGDLGGIGNATGRVLTIDDWFDELMAPDRMARQAASWVLAGFVLTYTLIAVANTSLMSFGSRQREFELLKKLGATRAQTLRLIAWESLSLGATGILLGGVVAVGTCVATWLLALESLPTAPLALPWIEFLLVGGSCLLITVGTALLPTLFGSRDTRVGASTSE
ncbi:MacB-like periplasmic core domain/FtsX-like permease family [Actinoalloteichus hymeniacidonis]|uniref:MacB-like periplasmic core domain/FtsX-like permease family n=2 Tax=Actinoalloteichus hymeniacidonis TaxID=340345 RepID=A0AAC9HM85_9PSEU|nr:MacB-like periplasmic core domain/FtsX-like permease family [Actinoalloteichus hymeniacidonis]